MNRSAALAIAAIVLVSLTGCMPSTPEPSPTVAATPSSPAPSTTPTPPPGDAALVIPDCESMLSLAAARSVFSESTEFLGEFPAADFGTGRFEIPAIQSALLGAGQSRFCQWGVPNSDGVFALVVAEITPADRASLIAALSGAGFGSSTSASVTTLEHEQEGMILTDAATHLFTGDSWILCDGTSLSLTGEVAHSALTAIRAANPTLGL